MRLAIFLTLISFASFGQIRLSELNNKGSITGTEKIPVSGAGNPSITPNLLSSWLTGTGNFTTGTGTTNLITYWTGAGTIGGLTLSTYPSLTELSYVKGVTSSIQTQIDTKAAGSGTTNELSYWSGTNTLSSLSTVTYPSLTELSYVKGLTSAAQTQLNARWLTAGNTSITNDVYILANTDATDDLYFGEDVALGGANRFRDYYFRSSRFFQIVTGSHWVSEIGGQTQFNSVGDILFSSEADINIDGNSGATDLNATVDDFNLTGGFNLITAPSESASNTQILNRNSSSGAIEYVDLSDFSDVVSQEISGTTYTLTSADNGKFLYATNASGCTITVGSVAVNFNVVIMEDTSAGTVTLSASGTTLSGKTSTTGDLDMISLLQYKGTTYIGK